MIALTDGSVILRQGEPLPAYCRTCERYYPVPLAAGCSRCPWCEREQIHAQTNFTLLNPETKGIPLWRQE